MVAEDPRGRAGRGSPLVLPEWLEAGIAGGLAVVAVFWTSDLMAGDPYRTPAALGTLIFSGFYADATVPGAAAAYHLLHFVAWIVLGLLAARLMRKAEDDPSLRWLPVALLLCLVGALGIGHAVLPDAAVNDAIFWLAGLAGIAVLGGFLLWRHPGVLGRPAPDPAAGSDSAS